MRLITTLLALSAVSALASCNNRADPPDSDQPEPTASSSDGLTPDPDAPISIIRPDVEQPDAAATSLEPLEVTIGFPEGGSDLDAAAIAALEIAAASELVAEGGTITLRGHSDAGGSDAVNMRASLARAEEVRDWLVNKGVEEARISVIAFGEQNPIEPNALPDGSPNEAGRAANRRVDITISVVSPDAPPIMKTPEPKD